MKPRKLRSDSAATAVQAARQAQEAPIALPGHLRVTDAEKPFLDAVLKARARDEWTAVDLPTAVDLARTMASIEELQKVVDREGYVIENGTGRRVVHPAAKLLDVLTTRSLRQQRFLQISPAGRGLRREDLEPQRRLEQRAREVADRLRQEAADDDALLA